MKKIFALAVFLSALYFSARLVLVWDRPNSDSPARVAFEIPRGANLAQISEILSQKELVRDELAFRLFARWKGLSEKFQAGEFIISRNLKMSEIAEILQSGKTAEIKITIPEGSTIAQIDEILAKKNLILPGEFADCASFCDFASAPENFEGYLFPSTYFVNQKNFSNQKFIARLHRTFLQKVAPFKKDFGDRSLDQMVKVASMIEREAFGDSLAERKIISGIIWKRLRERIHLGIDATTRYEIGDWKRPLLAADFSEPTPYNSRKVLGLPPTAISNFSIESLQAAVFPEETEFYYYLHDRSGQIHFGRNLAEHQENKQRYLR